MKISARNRLKGKIVDVKKGATTAHVRLDVNGTTVTASITNGKRSDQSLPCRVIRRMPTGSLRAISR